MKKRIHDRDDPLHNEYKEFVGTNQIGQLISIGCAAMCVRTSNIIRIIWSSIPYTTIVLDQNYGGDRASMVKDLIADILIGILFGVACIITAKKHKEIPANKKIYVDWLI